MSRRLRSVLALLALVSAAPVVHADPLALATATALEVAGIAPPRLEFDALTPRRRGAGGWLSHVDASSVSQVHVGFVRPSDDAAAQFLLGVRGGPMLDPHVQIGAALDWSHRTQEGSTVQHRSTGPNGVPITVTVQLSRASTDLVPVMAFLQYSLADDMPVVPYLGVAGGYEWMHLAARDYLSGASFDATYGGWGWQLWGGAALPLSGRTRLDGELFVNGGTLGRDATDDLTGITYRETVKADGIGMRFGLAWGF